ncbi:DUF2513 domain-containing protein [Paracoccus sp. 22332]|uniref:DUF2513 domain-containing protein n=1 Tax=Paracoccus sp. 22332 TaxID=3453913 RepID=UPI003F85D343
MGLAESPPALDHSRQLLEEISGAEMKLDMGLVRDILLWVETEQVTAIASITNIPLEGRSHEEIAYHVAIMERDNLIEAGLNRVGGNSPGSVHLLYNISSLTMQGHGLLDMIREKSGLQRAREIAGKAGSASLAAIYKALEGEAIERIMAFLGGK